MTDLTTNDFPLRSYVSTDPDCPETHKHLVQTFRLVPYTTPEKERRYRREIQWNFYGANEEQAKLKAKVWITGELEAAAKSQIGKERRKKGFYRKKAERA